MVEAHSLHRDEIQKWHISPSLFLPYSSIICLISSPRLSCWNSLGWMESRLISLVFDLEKNSETYVRPFPSTFINLHEQIEKEEKGKGKCTRALTP